ncbi:MAG: hypothetical protein CV087_10010 [Candidatus Brocadia sp. WS118]|nr:MAG: hypothetical protein CV087_10010 [Candidatus Brocadia sp. WS118]
MIEAIFRLSESIRYVAIYMNGQLEFQSKANTLGASSSESDKYEELLVNPTLLKLTSQRGNIDCGGLEYLIVRYGNFFQFVLPTTWGHVSVCIEADADPMQVGVQVQALVQAEYQP